MAQQSTLKTAVTLFQHFEPFNKRNEELLQNALNSRATPAALNEEGFVWPEDERRSASRYNTIAVMHKHKIAGEVGLMINLKKMAFQHSPGFIQAQKIEQVW